MEIDNELLTGIGKAMAGSLELHKKTAAQVDDLYARLGAPGNHNKQEHRMYSNGFKSAGQRFAEQGDDFTKSFGQTGRFRFQVGEMFNHDLKATYGSTEAGFGTAGVIDAQRVGGIVSGARRKLTIRDLLPAKRCDTSLIDFPRETSFTSAASPQTELAAKGESTFALSIASVRVSTIAHFVNVSNQLLADVKGIQQYLDETMLFYLRLKEEQEFLTGDGLGTHQTGLITGATAYLGSYAVAGDTILDKLFHYITEAQIADEDVNFFVLNPIDFARASLVKTEPGAANSGSYLIGDPNVPGGALQVPTIWGKPVVVTRSMPSGKCLAGDSSKATIYDRADATIDVSREHSSNFTSNISTILAETRTCIAISRASAFRYGSI